MSFDKKEFVLKQLEKFVEKTSKIPNLNYGGCGITAYYIAKILDYYDEKFSVIYVLGWARRDRGLKKEIIKGLKNKRRGDCISIVHVLIKWRGYIIDGVEIVKGKHNSYWLSNGRDGVKIKPGINTFSNITDPNYNTWNSTFQRSKYENKIVKYSRECCKPIFEKPLPLVMQKYYVK